MPCNNFIVLIFCKFNFFLISIFLFITFVQFMNVKYLSLNVHPRCHVLLFSCYWIIYLHESGTGFSMIKRMFMFLKNNIDIFIKTIFLLKFLKRLKLKIVNPFKHIVITNSKHLWELCLDFTTYCTSQLSVLILFWNNIFYLNFLVWYLWIQEHGCLLNEMMAWMEYKIKESGNKIDPILKIHLT